MFKHGLKIGFLPLLTAALLTITVAPARQAEAGAGAPVSITIGHTTIEDGIEDFVGGYLNMLYEMGGSRVVLHLNQPEPVQVLYKNQKTLRLVLNLRAKIGRQSIPIRLRFDTEFGCPFSVNGRLITIHEPVIEILGYTTAGYESLIIDELNDFIDSQMSGLVATMKDQLRQVTGTLNSSQGLICPHYEMFIDDDSRNLSSNAGGASATYGGFGATIDLANGCVDDENRTEVCPADPNGEINYTCDNGYWYETDRYCEHVDGSGVVM